MSQVDEFCYRSHRMDLEEDFYAYGQGTELVLAAQLGNALLLENRQLKDEMNTLQQQFTEQIEDLEQGSHKLRLKLQDCKAQWESQVYELERDVQALNAHVECLTRALSKAEREKSQSEQQHKEISQHLRDQLKAAMEVEQTVTAELQSLKQQLRERGHSRPQDEELLSALREQVARLTQREQALAQRLKKVCEENTELRDSVSSLSTRLTLQEQQSHVQTQQLEDAWREVEAAKGRAQELHSQVEVLQEEVSLQHNNTGNGSLLSEMEQSLDAMNRSQEKQEQVIQELSSLLDILLPISHHKTDSLSQDDGVQGILGQLKTQIERIVHSHSLQELKQPIVGEGSAPCETAGWIQELQDQNAQLLRENTELKLKAGNRIDEEIVQRAIKDRDDAIAKKTAVEAELMRSKNDMMCLNNQLLEAIQRKLELSQELEAWQDDIQIIINQQLKSQAELQAQAQSSRSGGGHLSFLRKPQKSSFMHEVNSVPNYSAWRDWFKLGK